MALKIISTILLGILTFFFSMALYKALDDEESLYIKVAILFFMSIPIMAIITIWNL